MSKITNNDLTQMLYSCTHMATVGVKGLKAKGVYISSLENPTSELWDVTCSHSFTSPAIRHKWIRPP